MVTETDPPRRVLYEPLILAAVKASGEPMTRVQIGAALAINPENIGNALGRLVGRGELIAHPQPRGKPRLYHLPGAAAVITKRGVRKWIATSWQQADGPLGVSLPIEPWADTAAQGRVRA